MTSPQRRSNSTIVTVALGACFVALAACGDRSLGLPDADGGAAGQPYPTGTGTDGQAGGAQGQAGAGGRAGSAGATGGAAGGEVGPCACPAIECATGFVLTPDAASCCPVCKPIVCNGACDMPSCGPNSHLEKAPGQCCATCMPGVDDSACTAGQQRYDATRAELIEKYTEGGCASDGDCALFYEQNQCAFDCGMAVNASLATQASSNLDAEAKMDCGTCKPPIPPPCALLTALCSNGKCVAGIPPPR